MRVLSVVGVPGAGKTSLVREAMSRADDWTGPWSAGLLRFHRSAELNLCVLGVYDDPGEVFAGTDRLSMAVQPHALRWIRDHARQSTSILVEGDRLGNLSFLHELVKMLDLGVFPSVTVLEAAPEVLRERRAGRGSSQSEAFLRGRATKVARIRDDPWLGHVLSDGLRVRHSLTPADRARIADECLAFLRGGI